MTDINGNFNFEPKGDYNNKINKFKHDEPIEKDEPKDNLKPQSELHYAPEVLGRSQVASPIGSDPTQSIIKALDITEHTKAEVLSAADEIFDDIYDKAVENGDNPEIAYAKASAASEEFLDIAKARES